jgi:UrcA family protein
MLVSYGHLDLGRAGAIDAVYRQLTVAAARACGAYESRNLRARDDWRRCRDAALSEVVAHFVEARIATLPTNDGVEVAVLRSN